MRRRRTPVPDPPPGAPQRPLPEVEGKPSLYAIVQQSRGAPGVELNVDENMLDPFRDLQRRARERTADDRRSVRHRRTAAALKRTALVVLLLLAVLVLAMTYGRAS